MSHPVADTLVGITDPQERHRIKALAFAALTSLVGTSITRGAFTVTLTSAAIVPAHGLLEFNLKITRTSNGKDVTPADLNPIRVYNPPILVDDPAGDIVRTWTHPETQEVMTRRLKEDLPAALLDIVRDLARQRLG
jgi:hypothetical protein